MKFHWVSCPDCEEVGMAIGDGPPPDPEPWLERHRPKYQPFKVSGPKAEAAVHGDYRWPRVLRRWLAKRAAP